MITSLLYVTSLTQNVTLYITGGLSTVHTGSFVSIISDCSRELLVDGNEITSRNVESERPPLIHYF